MDGASEGFQEGVSMTLKQFLRKYNKCPFCRSYAIQGNLCYGCKWRFGHGQYAKEGRDFDLFDPKPSWSERMNKEVTEWDSE